MAKSAPFKGIVLAASVLTLAGGLGAQAQAGPEFNDADGSFRAHVASICPALAGSASTAQETDLFLRCNGVLSQPGAGLAGLTEQGAILDQYLGVQNVAQQADAATKANRADHAVAGRLSAVAGQMRGRQFGDLIKPGAIILASNDPDDITLPAGPRDSALDGFFSIGGYDGEQDSTAQELGFDQEGFWVAGGLDYSFSNDFVAGAALAYVDGTADFKSIGGLNSGGSMNSESWSLSLYGVYLPDDRWELNGLVGFGQTDFKNKRNISIVDRNGDPNGGGGQSDPNNLANIQRTAVSESEADTMQINLGASYLLYNEGATAFTPMAEISYYNADIGGFSETGSNGLDLTFDSQEVDSLQISVGGTLSHVVSADWGVFVPYARARAIFETQDDEQSVIARYTASGSVASSVAAPTFTITTNPADESSFDIAIGASAVMASGLTAFAEFQTVAGLDNVTHNAIAAGLRFEF